MDYHEENPLSEVRRIRAELLKEYGGIDGWHKHNMAERPRLEKEGWRFATSEELEALKHRHHETLTSVEKDNSPPK
jgi:hypothetical protein